MNKLKSVVWLFLMGCSSLSFSQNPPLKVGVVSFEPPFVMQAKNHFYGFDISLMERICKGLDRPCQYQLMRFEELIPAVVNGDIDVAVSAITITLPRASQVLFSNPYYRSQARFLARKAEAVQPFLLSQLNNKTIGVEEGTILGEVAGRLNIKNASIESYENANEAIEKLNEESLDYLLMDDQAAKFWQLQTSGILLVVGQPIDYGGGYGIAINLNNLALQGSINNILDNYMKTGRYQKDIQKYFGH